MGWSTTTHTRTQPHAKNRNVVHFFMQVTQLPVTTVGPRVCFIFVVAAQTGYATSHNHTTYHTKYIRMIITQQYKYKDMQVSTRAATQYLKTQKRCCNSGHVAVLSMFVNHRPTNQLVTLQTNSSLHFVILLLCFWFAPLNY